MSETFSLRDVELLNLFRKLVSTRVSHLLAVGDKERFLFRETNAKLLTVLSFCRYLSYFVEGAR